MTLGASRDSVLLSRFMCKSSPGILSTASSKLSALHSSWAGSVQD